MSHLTVGAHPRVIATCWTSAGDVAPLHDPELSPFPALERIRAVAATGWAGIGCGQDDLRAVRDSVGFPAVRAAVRDPGLRHVEVELCSGWWRGDDLGRRDT